MHRPSLRLSNVARASWPRSCDQFRTSRGTRRSTKSIPQQGMLDTQVGRRFLIDLTAGIKQGISGMSRTWLRNISSLNAILYRFRRICVFGCELSHIGFIGPHFTGLFCGANCSQDDPGVAAALTGAALMIFCGHTSHFNRSGVAANNCSAALRRYLGHFTTHHTGRASASSAAK